MRLLFIFYVAIFHFFSFSISATDDLPKIHIIGDSHSFEFNLIPGCIVHWVGPITMHRIGRDGLFSLNVSHFNIQEGEVVIFAFGEIDVRCHIGKQRDLKLRSIEEIINNLANNYLYRILELKSCYKNLTCIVYSVTPPTNAHFSELYPYYGDLEDRVNITKLLNTKLAEMCHFQNLLFLDVYEDYANSDGTLNFLLSDGNVHINSYQYIAIQQKINAILKVR